MPNIDIYFELLEQTMQRKIPIIDIHTGEISYMDFTFKISIDEEGNHINFLTKENMEIVYKMSILEFNDILESAIFSGGFSIFSLKLKECFEKIFNYCLEKHSKEKNKEYIMFSSLINNTKFLFFKNNDPYSILINRCGYDEQFVNYNFNVLTKLENDNEVIKIPQLSMFFNIKNNNIEDKANELLFFSLDERAKDETEDVCKNSYFYATNPIYNDRLFKVNLKEDTNESFSIVESIQIEIKDTNLIKLMNSEENIEQILTSLAINSKKKAAMSSYFSIFS